MRTPRRFGWLLLATSLAACGSSRDESSRIRLATTTSAVETGLLPDVLVPAFTRETGIEVDVLPKGTGEALKLGERGDADVVLVHARAAEDEFMAKGFGVERRDAWWNRFVLVGPRDDPAKAREGSTASEALRRIRDAKATFVSRGDDSGTHKREKALWGKDFAKWPSYVESGQGQSQTLSIADEKDGYALTDEGTFLKHRKRLRLVPLVAGDPALLNPYGVILVRPDPKRPEASAAARRFLEWTTSESARALVRAYRIDGERPFFLPDESPPATAK
jgi:tungstate transport system substrate-binding protein